MGVRLVSYGDRRFLRQHRQKIVDVAIFFRIITSLLHYCEFLLLLHYFITVNFYYYFITLFTVNPSLLNFQF